MLVISFYNRNENTSFIKDMICRICLQPADIPITDKIEGTSILNAIKIVSDNIVSID